MARRDYDEVAVRLTRAQDAGLAACGECGTTIPVAISGLIIECSDCYAANNKSSRAAERRARGKRKGGR